MEFDSPKDLLALFIEVLNSDGLTELEVSSCLLELFLDESEEGGLLKELSLLIRLLWPFRGMAARAWVTVSSFVCFPARVAFSLGL